MNYLKVKWVHRHQTEPVILFSELDEDRYEVRKVEVFVDGRKGYASTEKSLGGTILGEYPVPLNELIALDAQFEVQPTDADEFETVWAEATKNG